MEGFPTRASRHTGSGNAIGVVLTVSKRVDVNGLISSQLTWSRRGSKGSKESCHVGLGRDGLSGMFAPKK